MKISQTVVSCYNTHMRQLAADIKKGIYRRCYLLYGPESYNRRRYTDALVDLFLPDRNELNLSYFYGKKTDIKEVISLAGTMPFMSERRVIVLENTGLFSTSCDELADLIPGIPESCCLIFSEEKADMRLKQTKAVKADGCIALFDHLSEKDIRSFVIGRISREHRAITQSALDLFVRRCQNDLWQVSNELEKVISYTFGKDGIRTEDIEAVCPAPAEDRVFAMIDAILDGNEKKAMAFYKDLLALKSNPHGILSLLSEQFRLMLHAYGTDVDDMSLKDSLQLLHVSEYRYKMALRAAKKSSKINMIRRIQMCADTESRIKTGLTGDVIGVETLILQLCGEPGSS